MGGMVAQMMLRRRPERYPAAVLSCTSPAFGNADGDFQKKFVADRLGPLEAGKSMADLAPALVDRMIGPSADPAGRAFAIEVMSAVPAGTYGAAVRCLVGFDERANLPGSHSRTVFGGRERPNAPAAGMERMAAKIPGSRYFCLRNAGHLPNLEDRLPSMQPSWGSWPHCRPWTDHNP